MVERRVCLLNYEGGEDIGKGGGGCKGRRGVYFDSGVKSTLTVTARGGKWRVSGYLVSLHAPPHWFDVMEVMNMHEHETAWLSLRSRHLRDLRS